MLSPQPEDSQTIFKNPLLYTSTALILVVLVIGGIFFFRWQGNRDIERRANEERTQKQIENDRRSVEQLGGAGFSILSLYANPGHVRRGEEVQLCYGVSGAKNVKLEPQPNPVWPSPSRCVYVTPTKDTTYTLTADDGAGHTKTATVEVKMR